jgi:hypothetical protein
MCLELVFVCVMWEIWIDRNNWKFNGVEVSFIELNSSFLHKKFIFLYCLLLGSILIG